MAELNYESYLFVGCSHGIIRTFKKYKQGDHVKDIQFFAGFPLLKFTPGWDNEDIANDIFGVRRDYSIPSQVQCFGAKVSADILEEANIKDLFNCDFYELWRSVEADKKNQVNVFFGLQK